MKNKKKNNTLLFFLFTIITIIIIVLFGFFLKIALSKEKEQHEVTIDNILFTESGNIVEVTNKSYISTNWNNKYYLYSKKEKVNLGNYVLSYNKINNSISFYGDLYKVNVDADVKILHDYSELNDSSATFYKIEDRKYLFVDSNMISSDNNTLSTSKFLIITLDRKGNASFLNNSLDFKTINSLQIIGTRFTFDIAKEKLIVNNKFIDLKNIIGSTNDYIEKEEETNPLDGIDYLTDNFNKYINEINTGGDVINNNTNIVEKEDSNNNNSQNIIYSKWINLTSVNPGVNYINVNYLIFDPSNEYSNVYLSYVETGSDDVKTINISKESSNYTIYGLKPMTQYRVELKYTINGIEYTSDSIIFKTLVPEYQVVINNIDYSKKVINYTINSNDKIIFDSMDVLLCSGSCTEEADFISKNILDATSCKEASLKTGYSGSFSYENAQYGDLFTIKVDNILYNKAVLDFNFNTKFLNK